MAPDIGLEPSRPAASLVHRVDASSLGSATFRQRYRVKLAYLCGAMYKGVASKELVVAAGREGLLAYFGAGGLSLERIDADVNHIRRAIEPGAPFGVNLLHSPDQPRLEQALVELLLRHGVTHADASAFVEPTAALAYYRLKGATRGSDGRVIAARHLMAKVSRPEVAEAFMSPADGDLLRGLVESGHLTQDEALLGAEIPLAGEVCVEADSGGHTDRGIAVVLLPAILRLRERLQAKHRYAQTILVGAAGGIGTPEAAACMFVLGADFILTGSINQCTVESGASDAVKDMLQMAQVQDTDYAPAGDMFESGAQVQVLRKGVLFPGRGRKLLELYRQHASIDDIDARTRQQIETRYFKRSFDDVWAETEAYYAKSGRRSVSQLSAKEKMALIFRWYFVHSTRLALEGNPEHALDFQIHCGPALGAFNQWVQGTELESWRSRHVADIALRLMAGTAQALSARLDRYLGGTTS